jgi:hypothetical protein
MELSLDNIKDYADHSSCRCVAAGGLWIIPTSHPNARRNCSVSDELMRGENFPMRSGT